ncbi:MAG: DinB family protein [Gemmatimonadales bacterium]
MTFSNPAGAAATAAPAYVRALLDLLGSRPPLDVLGELLPWLEHRLGGVPDAVLRRPEAPGKWPVVAVVRHLADTELVYGFRGRMVLAEDRPPLHGFDQDGWAATFGYADAPLDASLAQLAAMRTANLALWRSLGPTQLARVGRHSERGPESMDLMLRMMAAHDLVHRRQIDRVLG